MNLKFRHWDSIFCSNFIESYLYRSARSDNPRPHHTTIIMGTVTKTVISSHFVLDNLKHNKKYQFQDSWGRYKGEHMFLAPDFRHSCFQQVSSLISFMVSDPIGLKSIIIDTHSAICIRQKIIKMPAPQIDIMPAPQHGPGVLQLGGVFWETD